MAATQQFFLQALCAALQGQSVTWQAGTLEPRQWTGLFQLAQSHHVLPLIFEAVYACPAAQNAPELPQIRQQAVHTVLLQAAKTDEFLRLQRHLQAQGLHPLVVKGIVCRSLYPQPDHRLSGDEDLLATPGQFHACQDALTQFGLSGEGSDAYEIPFRSADTPLYIELHRSLFPPENEAYGDLNRFFADVHHRAVTVTVDGTEVWTMAPSDHLFYLICHAFKHFLHSGFGIRQVCDIVLFANRYGAQIDWQQLFDNCRQINAHLFAAAIFRIGENHLTFDKHLACYPAFWQELQVEEGLLLEDLLDAGVYGYTTLSRRHSSTMTLSAVAAQKQGKKSGGILRTLFPGADALKGQYPYLAQQPYLLPKAWAQRLIKYHRETKATENNSASVAIEMGNRRIALLKAYGILESSQHPTERKRDQI